MTAFHPTTQTFRQGSRTMPQEYYTSPAILAEEAERLFLRQWHCVGRVSRFEQPGDWVQRSIAGESIIILRDRQGEIRAFFNVCRHRGTRICREASGQFSETIQCPYHAWTWTTDGKLIGAPHMQDVEGFDKRDYPLHGVPVAEWEGFVFVNLDDRPVPFTQVWAPMLGRLGRFDLAGLKVGHGVRYDVQANWKLVFQNYSECLHCPMIHPQLNPVLPYQSGANDLVEGPFLGGYMELTAGNDSATMTGRACGLPVSAKLAGEDLRRAYYYTLMPNMLLSLHPDYVNYYIVSPVSVNHTVVESEWMFNPESQASERFNPEDAIKFWDLTNRQDWDIVERSQLGIGSRKYQPGPYSTRESIPAAWDREYLRMMGRE
ncbi:MAG TPA: aromatic ring-hydroxylating dioxygenase subunit alpha [Gemmatimonadales bacterium]